MPLPRMPNSTSGIMLSLFLFFSFGYLRHLRLLWLKANNCIHTEEVSTIFNHQSLFCDFFDRILYTHGHGVFRRVQAAVGEAQHIHSVGGSLVLNPSFHSLFSLFFLLSPLPSLLFSPLSPLSSLSIYSISHSLSSPLLSSLFLFHIIKWNSTQNRSITAQGIARTIQGISGQNTVSTASDSFARGNFRQVTDSLGPVALSFTELPLEEPDGRHKVGY